MSDDRKDRLPTVSVSVLLRVHHPRGTLAASAGTRSPLSGCLRVRSMGRRTRPSVAASRLSLCSCDPCGLRTARDARRAPTGILTLADDLPARPGKGSALQTAVGVRNPATVLVHALDGAVVRLAPRCPRLRPASRSVESGACAAEFEGSAEFLRLRSLFSAARSRSVSSSSSPRRWRAVASRRRSDHIARGTDHRRCACAGSSGRVEEW